VQPDALPFFQCHHSLRPIFQFGQGSLAGRKSPRKRAIRPSARDRMPGSRKRHHACKPRTHENSPAHARSCRAPVFSKMLLVIAPGWIQQPPAENFPASATPFLIAFVFVRWRCPADFWLGSLGGWVALPESRDGPRRRTGRLTTVVTCRLGRVRGSARSLPFLLVAPVLLFKIGFVGSGISSDVGLFRLRATPKAQASDRPSRAPNYMGRACQECRPFGVTGVTAVVSTARALADFRGRQIRL